MAVVVHGTAHEVDAESDRGRGYREYLVEVYGREMGEWQGNEVVYWEIEPRRMFALAPQV